MGDIMDLNYLRRAAATFAYQLRKFFPEDEVPINHYVCENHVVVLSSKKLYIYYCENYIDYVGDFLSNVIELNRKDEDRRFEVSVNNKDFNLVFESEKDVKSFLFYFDKYRE